MAEDQKIFKQIERREYWWMKVRCVIYQWICLHKLYILMENFFFSNFYFVFELLAENRKIFKRMAIRILLKFYCFLYQWIRLENLYKFNGKLSSNFWAIFGNN